MIDFSFWAVVTWANKAKLLTKPHEIDSGVSLGHIIPHWEGCNERGPPIFLVFSNWELILTIKPNADIYDILLNNSVTPPLVILNLFITQFPVAIVSIKPWVIILLVFNREISRVLFPSFMKDWSICFFKSLLNFLNKSSNNKAIKLPANSNLLFP